MNSAKIPIENSMETLEAAPMVRTQSCFRRFVVIWLGQLVSGIGSGMTGFALGIWLYRRTGSVTQLAMLSIAGTIPGMIVLPFAGVVVDRWDRWRLIIFSDFVAGIFALLIAGLLMTGHLTLGGMVVIVFLSSGFYIVGELAFQTSAAQMVSADQLVRANGFLQFIPAVSAVLAPLLAGALLGFVKIQAILFIDFATFVIAIALTAFSRIPAARAPERKTGASIFSDILLGWRYLKARPSLLGVLKFFVVLNFIMAMVNVLATPLALSFTSPAVLGRITSTAGIGMIVGSAVLGVWGGPKRRMVGFFMLLLVSGLSLVAAGARRSPWELGAAAFAFFFSFSFASACIAGVVQAKVSRDVQGRVFSVMGILASASTPVGFLVAGPLADHVFEPMLRSSGLLAASVGRIIGTGPGRGIGLLFMVFGLLIFGMATWGYTRTRIRYLETELPDAIALATADT
jgi:MFS transporter, DHA3 family, macrolide efflux protein